MKRNATRTFFYTFNYLFPNVIVAKRKKAHWIKKNVIVERSHDKCHISYLISTLNFLFYTSIAYFFDITIIDRE